MCTNQAGSSGGGAGVPVAGSSGVGLGLDPRIVLLECSQVAVDRAVRARVVARQADRELLCAAYDFAVVNPGQDVGRVDSLADRRVLVAGEGACGVAESAITWFAQAIGMREFAARNLLGEAIELAERLPGIWSAVLDGVLASFKARNVASRTLGLSQRAVSYVDRVVAPGVVSMSMVRIEHVVQEARELYDDVPEPELGEDWGVCPGLAGLSADGSVEVVVRADKPDVDRFQAALTGVADLLAARGDGRNRGCRISTALGLLADPHTAVHWLDGKGRGGKPVVGQPGAVQSGATQSGATGLGAVEHDPIGVGYFGSDFEEIVDASSVYPGPDFESGLVAGFFDTSHTDFSVTDESATEEPSVFPPVTFDGCVELVIHASAAGLGPAQVKGPRGGVLGLVAPEAVDRWLSRFTGKLVVTPVVDPDEWIEIDGYQPSQALRRQIQYRDRACVFPGCAKPAEACDLDHIIPWPRGSTTTGNLAPLCRHHHRMKTHHGWDYQRLPDGAYLWHTPTGDQHLHHPATGSAPVTLG